jgi:trans-2,3-dihydro-3-hydroxyanthranilate isomerase
MDFWTVSVFLDRSGNPLRGGNPLAVFPRAEELDGSVMQAIAQSFNLSETTFVTTSRDDHYDVRIFTPAEELAFAGHPTIGTAWVLNELGVTSGGTLTQRSLVGSTRVWTEAGRWWFERSGRAFGDLEKSDLAAPARLARALGVDEPAIGLEARELGRAGRLVPAVADAGFGHLMVPLRDTAALGRVSVRADLLSAISDGVYCFTAVAPGRIRARGFFPGVGIAEDPATGSAAAELGILLADRLGAVEFEVDQGVEIDRPARISVRAEPGRVEVGGACGPISKGSLAQPPVA